ncbi:MAG: dihydrofolate reductase [Bacteroidia bacterium]
MKLKKTFAIALAIISTITISNVSAQAKKPVAGQKMEPKPAAQQQDNPATIKPVAGDYPATIKPKAETTNMTITADLPKEVLADRFADVQVLRYGIPGFNDLSLNQKKLAYYLYEAGLCGRDIFWDQKYKYSLMIRKALENILTSYKGNRTGKDWNQFDTYCKQVFFANGIHHHYSNAKIMPEFSNDYFKVLMRASSHPNLVPGMFKTNDDAYGRIADIIFSKSDLKSVDLSAGIDNVKASCNNFYEGVTQQEVEDFYNQMGKDAGKQAPSFGLNSKLIKEDDGIKERVWKVGGMYGPAMEQMVKWLRKAEGVAENKTQSNTFHQLADYFETGDLKKFDEYNISWVSDTVSRIDVALGFIEVYHDAIGKKGSYESVVSMKDMQASKLIAKIGSQAQWFEDNSPLMTEHKKKNVKGISAKVITVIGEGGDAAPVTPIGINLPNAEWIREEYGSKSVSLGNIVSSYNYVRAKSPMIDEFGSNPEVIARVKKYGALAGDLHTDMHEVIGHASGQLNPGVATTDITLKNYASTLEEARADLVGLYYIMDNKLIELGVMPSLEVGKAQYDSYILNGLMTQLYRIKPGDNIEESHMRNRQLISKWVLEKGADEKVIERTTRDGKTYFVINDYNKLRTLFGQLLREIQRIKSEGDFNAGKNLVENYGVIADQDLLKEVHARYEKLNIAPYMGFIQPKLIPVYDSNKNITDVKVDCNQDFMQQMLEYGKKYSFLPVMN